MLRVRAIATVSIKTVAHIKMAKINMTMNLTCGSVIEKFHQQWVYMFMMHRLCLLSGGKWLMCSDGDECQDR